MIPETPLQVAGLRYYSPGLGRWTSRDPIGEMGGPNSSRYAANGPVVCSDALGLWTILPLSYVGYVLSLSDTQAIQDAHDAVRSGMGPLIAQTTRWLAKANDLPESCPWREGVLGQLKDLRVRLVRMNQELWGSAVLPVWAGGWRFFDPDTNAYSEPGFALLGYDIHLRPSRLHDPSLPELLFHELYHISDWSGVPKEAHARRYVDDAMAVEDLWGDPDFGICRLVADVVDGIYGGSKSRTGTNACCPNVTDWCFSP